jgi:NO-binding membrane sensor protein with MHYT domain
MSATTSTPEPMRKLVIWFLLLIVAIMAMHFTSCQSVYPAESKVLKQDTNRYNEKVGR